MKELQRGFLGEPRRTLAYTGETILQGGWQQGQSRIVVDSWKKGLRHGPLRRVSFNQETMHTQGGHFRSLESNPNFAGKSIEGPGFRNLSASPERESEMTWGQWGYFK